MNIFGSFERKVTALTDKQKAEYSKAKLKWLAKH